MIGIVVVSHSRALAKAAVGLAAEMVAEPDRPVISIAAGLDETTFGTDATAVAEAISSADSPDGVLVLLDLGSAVLSTEMALEFVDPELAERVVVSSAPLVEGLVAAVVLASTGAPIDAVAREAAQGLAGKQDHLGDGGSAEDATAGPADTTAGAADEAATAGAAAGAAVGPADGAAVDGGEEQTVELVVENPHGLHARPAAKLVAVVRSFEATVRLSDLTTGRGPIDAASLSMVATLNAQQGHRIRVTATGTQAAEALEAIRQLADRSFDDHPASTPSPGTTRPADTPDAGSTSSPAASADTPDTGSRSAGSSDNGSASADSAGAGSAASRVAPAGFADIGSPDVGSADVGSAEAASADTGSPHVGSTEAASADTGSPHVGSTEAASADTGSPHVGSTDAGSAGEGSADVDSADAGSADAGSADAGLKAARAGGSGSGLDLAIGPAVVAAGPIDLSGYEAADATGEAKRSEDARAHAMQDLDLLRTRTAEQIGAAEAAIFDAHLALLDDPAVLAPVNEAIAGGTGAPAAWTRSLDDLAAIFEKLDDPYQRERAQDVRSVRDRVLGILTGRSTAAEEPPEGGVLVVPELDAATAATLDAGRIAGVAVRAAGTTGHGVIVARSRGIPLITGIGDVAVVSGVVVAFDARANSFLVDPDERTRDDLRTSLARRTAQRDTALAQADEPAVTRDGRTIPVMVNVGSVEDARNARGPDGSGLVRTEVLFGDRRVAPNAAEQAVVFRAVAAALGGQPITIRTWDIGGDKPLRFLPQEPEANPFLGERGLRVFRRRPDLLREQLAAILEVARETPVQVMFPMVTTAEEVAWALAELAASGPRPHGLKVGIMVEVPAAALRVATLAAGLDFVSIGTNDLTQYTTAADRGNGAVAHLADGLDPAVLQLVDRVVRDVPQGVEVAVCGDLASDPDAAILLAALGVHELSAVGPQVPLVKARLREADLSGLAATAAHALTLGSAADVRALLASLP